MKISSFLQFTLALTGVLWLAGCTMSGGGYGTGTGFGNDRASSAPAPAPVMESSSAAGAIQPGRDAAQRPGLGTGWGESRASEVFHVDFQRASRSQPYASGTVYYSDKEGVAAMSDGYFPGRQPQPRTFDVGSSLVSIGLRDSSRRWWPGFTGSGGRNFVAGREGARYEIVLRNRSAARIEAVVSVDGLDVLDGQPAAVTRSGYVLNPGSELVIGGFRRSLGEVAAFRFSSVPKSYAARKGADTGNVGVIGLALFPEKNSDPGRPVLPDYPWAGAPDSRVRLEANPFPGSNGFASPP